MRILLRGALLSLSAVALAPTLACAINGNEWLTVPGAERSFYVIGVVDSWADASTGIQTMTKLEPAYLPGRYEDLLRSTWQCVKGKPYLQTIGVVERYMKDHPEAGQYTMPNIVLAAIRDTCKD